ncbi:DUF4214 domain-containing protein [Pseudoduganella sp. FT55W]|uniref:DUF4214 domain-containing protein n=1 Tax=Duganella rivi TaxID=2666083 RepID=A0A7X4KDR6_9BURK|nr:DUF4214 domain-containing protein [Duganella rivi]MYM69292.1 DUF4214 domain-containing protein [Duganella rivi]
MATININLRSNITTPFANAGAGIDKFISTRYAFDVAHASYTTGVLDGSTMTISYPDGAINKFSGVTLANPNAFSGSASATQQTIQQASGAITIQGTLNYHYDYGANGVVLAGIGESIQSASYHTKLADGQDYTVTLQGAVSVPQSGNYSGTLTSMTASSQGASSTLSGNFSVQGNAASVGPGLSSTVLSGKLDSISETYGDGSSFSATGLGLQISGSTVLGKALLENGNNFSGDDTINVTLPATLSTPWKLASGAGNDKIVIKGGGNGLSVDAGIGNDVITLSDSNHTVDGGAGIDTAVFGGARAAYTIAKTADGYSVKSSAGTDTLVGVERVQFSDSTMALDISGNGGQVYRLYQAAFNRVPDAGGLGYWIKSMDSGMSLDSIAGQFTQSGEFQAMYGATPSNGDFLDKLYHNVLHRGGDAGGTKYWLDILDTHALTQAQVLAFFGESPENQAALIGSIGNGFTFTPFG